MNTNTNAEKISHDSSTEKRFADLLEFQQLEPTDASSFSTKPLLPPEDLEAEISPRRFASNPTVKLILVAVIIGAIVFIVSLILSGSGSSFKVSKDPVTNTKKNQASLLTSIQDPKDKEIADLKAEAAVQKQKQYLKELEAQKAQKAQKPQRVEAKQPEKPTVQTTSVRSVPTNQVQTTSVRSIPTNRVQTTSVRSIPTNRVQQVVSQSPPRPVPHRPANRPAVVTPALAQATQDPTKQWAELSKVGSFGGSSSTTSPSNSRPSELSAPIYTPPSIPATMTNTRETTEVPKSEPNLADGNSLAILFGQSVSAILETPIAWEASRGSRTAEASDDRYILTLNQSLQDKLGNPQIPANSQVVIRLESSSNALVNLMAESIIIDRTEIKLPKGVLKIRGAGNQALIPEMRTLGGNGNNNEQSLTDILSIVGDLTNVRGLGSIDKISSLLGGGNRRQVSGFTATIFFLRKGIPLEIFVNKTFNLNIPESPLELDLSAIDSEQKAQANNQDLSSDIIFLALQPEKLTTIESSDEE